MRGRGWGRVINIASASVAIASPVSIAYRVSKMGIIGLTRALSATLGDEGITIAGAVALVASDEAGWITGQSILANGGNAFSI